MNIDNKHFLQFMQVAYFSGYIIKYIDKAHVQSICKNSATIINDEGKTHRLLSPKGEEHLLDILANSIENQDFCQLSSPIITTIFIRLGDAIVCLKHKSF